MAPSMVSQLRSKFDILTYLCFTDMCLIFFSSKGENQIFLFLEEEPPKRWDRGVWHFSKVGNQPR